MTEIERTYEFVAENGLSVTCLRGEEPPTITDGYGGWNVVDRPRRVGYAFWGGISPLKLKVPCLFDDWRDGHNVENDIGTLARMGQPPNSVSGDPPILNVIGAVPRKDIDRWVVETLEWGTNVIWGFDNHGAAVRFRQDVVVNLIQYVAPTALRHKATVTGSSSRPHSKLKSPYYVKRGDTLSKISARAYGNAKWWSVIAKANKIRDPKKIHTGQKLRIPA